MFPILLVLVVLALASPATAQSIGAAVFCIEGAERPCGMNTGICKQGISTCVNGHWSICQGGIEPTEEICGNDLDENCNGELDDCLGEAPPDIGLYLILAGIALFIIGGIIAIKEILGSRGDVRQPYI
ncbi:MAG: hypothetical protein KKA90_03920 [Nanoarchaeota archaeon]|nr:hypothetical protein [Nanoarchaeota archaeon]